jgi:hypothetical protein
VDELRDPERAFTLARMLGEHTSFQDAGYLDVLAASEAASGRYSAAAATARIALDLVRAVPDDAPPEIRARSQALRGEIERRIALYDAGRPYRSPATGAR